MTKEEIKGQDILKKIEAKENKEYLCDKKPGIFFDENGWINKVVTAGTQLCLVCGETNEIWAPSLYQSSMQPEKKEIRTLTIEWKEGTLYVCTRYGERSVDLEREEIKVSSWVPVIHKTDCRQCQNCGQCGW